MIGPENGRSDYFTSAYRDYARQNPRKKLEHYLGVIRSRRPADKPRLLDLGCGLGMFLQFLAENQPDWEIAGLDPDAGGVSRTQSLVTSAEVRSGSADDIPFDDSSFNVLTAWDVLEHVENLTMAISEINRCLKPGGLLSIVVPVYDGVTGIAIRALDRDPTHVHRESRGFWLELIGQGFDAVEWHGIYRYLITPTTYLHLPTQRLRRHTPAILITAINR